MYPIIFSTTSSLIYSEYKFNLFFLYIQNNPTKSLKPHQKFLKHIHIVGGFYSLKGAAYIYAV